MKAIAKWPSVSLPEAFWFQEGPGVRNWQFTASGIKLLNVANIEKDGTLNLEKTDRYLSESEVSQKYSHFLVDVDDLVIASSGIPFDNDGLLRTRGAFVQIEHLPLCLNTSTIRFKAIDGVSDLRFLRFWLNSIEFRSQITKRVTGTAQQNFGPSHLREIRIILPPLAEQRRIAAILDKADELRAKRRVAVAKLDTLTQSIFLDMFGDPITNPKGLPTKSLTSVCDCYSGGTPSKSESIYWNGHLPWFSPKDLKRDDLFDSEDHVKETVPIETNLRLLAPNTVAIVVRGMILTHTFPVSVLRVSATINQDLKALLPITGVELDSQFLAHCLRVQSRAVLSYVSESAHGTKRLDAGALGKIRVLFPSGDSQRHFWRSVARVEEYKAAAFDSLYRLDALFASLQHRAFRGEL